MFKRIIGGVIGAKLVKGSPAVGGATGVALATAIPFVISRVSLPAMLMLGAGGYLFKRYSDKQSSDKDLSGNQGQSALIGKPASDGHSPPTR